MSENKKQPAQTQIDPDTPFEDAIRELETIVRKLETGESPLEESIQSYERGVALKSFCENKLKDARMKIEKITEQNPDLAAEPFDPESPSSTS